MAVTSLRDQAHPTQECPIQLPSDHLQRQDHPHQAQDVDGQ
jgi:hypothetical protein